jgi:hypothetical protein
MKKDLTVKEVAAKTRATQVLKYGGEDGYRAEMRRRRSLVKAPGGFASMSKEKILAARSIGAETKLKKKAQNAKNNAVKSKDTPQSNNRS